MPRLENTYERIADPKTLPHNTKSKGKRGNEVETGPGHAMQGRTSQKGCLECLVFGELLHRYVSKFSKHAKYKRNMSNGSNRLKAFQKPSLFVTEIRRTKLQSEVLVVQLCMLVKTVRDPVHNKGSAQDWRTFVTGVKEGFLKGRHRCY